VEDSEGDRGLPNSPGTDESDGSEVFRKTNDLLDPFVASIEDSWWRWRGFSVYAKCKYQIPDPSVIEVADLVRIWARVSAYSGMNNVRVILTGKLLPSAPS
jgi:hypothetical protein